MTKLKFTQNSFLVFFVFASIFVYSALAFYVALFTTSEPTQRADVAIVLGARSYKNNNYNPCLVQRVKEGVALYNYNLVSRLIFTGGNDREDNANEAETMKKIALEQGVPEQVILLEKQATSTYENIVYSKEIMVSERFNSAIVVSEPFHIGRARLVSRSLNINAEYSVADNSPCWTHWRYASRYFLKEPLAILGYSVSGKVSAFSF